MAKTTKTAPAAPPAPAAKDKNGIGLTDVEMGYARRRLTFLELHDPAQLLGLLERDALTEELRVKSLRSTNIIRRETARGALAEDAEKMAVAEVLAPESERGFDPGELVTQQARKQLAEWKQTPEGSLFSG